MAQVLEKGVEQEIQNKEQMNNMDIRKEIKDCICTTLVIGNKESIELALDKIIKCLYKHENSLDLSNPIDKMEFCLEKAIKASKEVNVGYKPNALGVNIFNPDFGIEDMKGDVRYLPYADARHIFFYYAKRVLNVKTMASIGGYLNRDHSTALHGIRKVKGRINVDKDYREVIDRIEKEIVFYLQNYGNAID
jgi:chromosomal replication initiation ATPase DnaA